MPRHPQRFPELLRTLNSGRLRIVRRSALADDGPQDESREAQALFGDSMGEMYLYLAAADLAFVGGSLVEVGGHNILEPAAVGVPVLFGPHMSNFMAARALLLDAGAAEEVIDGDALASAVVRLLGDAARRQAMGQAGEGAVMANRGAKQRLLGLIETLPPAIR